MAIDSKKCNCPLQGSINVPYSGSIKSKIIFVGESPGLNEVKSGKPFIGRAGELLNNSLNIANILRSDLFITNSARCLIEKKVLPNTTIKKIIDACRPFLITAIKAIKPKLIICSGDIALRQIIKKSGITKHRGNWMFSEEFNCHVFPMYHPAYILRREEFKSVFINDLKTVKKFIDNDYSPPKLKLESFDYQTDVSIMGILHAKEAIVAIDTEGQGLKWTDKNYPMISYSVSPAKNVSYNIFFYEECDLKDKKKEFEYYALRKVGKKKEEVKIGIARCPDFKSKLMELKQLLEAKHIKKFMQNGNFDMHVFKNLFNRYKIKTSINNYVLDTQAGAQLINENLYKQASLENLQKSFTDFEVQYSQAFTKKYSKDDMLAVPKKVLAFYANADASVTRQAGMSIRDIIKKDKKLLRYLVKFVMPTLKNTLFTLEENGAVIDMKQLPKTQKKLAKEVDKFNKQASDLIPEKVINKHFNEKKKENNMSLSRGDLIRDVFFSKNGFGMKSISKTKTGKSIDKSTRKELLRLDSTPEKAKEFINNYDQWKVYDGFLNRNIGGFTKNLHADGRLHPSCSLTMAVTGRASISSPNLMATPKRSKLSYYVRELIIAPKGWLLLSVDADQAELRWLAHVANETNMINIFKKGLDIHINTGESLVNKKAQDMSKEELKDVRQKAKIANFGLAFLMTPKGFVQYAKDEYETILTLEEAEKWIYIFFNKLYPQLKTYHERAISFCKKHGYIESPLGRKRRLPEINSENRFYRGQAERMAVNHPIQSPSSDTMLMSCNEMIIKKLLNPEEIKPILFVHDELTFEVRDNSKAIDYAKIIKHETENPPLERDFSIRLRVPLLSSVSIGKNLAKMEELNL